MKILLTGADGFIGESLVSRLIEYPNNLFLIGENIESLKRRYGSSHTYLSHVDLNQNELTLMLTEYSPDIVIHLAAYSTASDSYDEMERLFNANILFLGKILDALKRTNIKSLIFTGSSTEYGNGNGVLNPAYLYSATKIAGRSILSYYSDTYNFKTIIVTPYNVYGGFSNQKKILDILFDSLEADSPVDTTLGEQVLDFIHISDLGDLFIEIVKNIDKIPDKTNFHAGTGQGNTIRKLATLIEEISGKKTNINWGGIPYRKKDTMYSVADIRQQQELLNWEPCIDLESGIRKYLESRD